MAVNVVSTDVFTTQNANTSGDIYVLKDGAGIYSPAAGYLGATTLSGADFVIHGDIVSAGTGIYAKAAGNNEAWISQTGSIHSQQKGISFTGQDASSYRNKVVNNGEINATTIGVEVEGGGSRVTNTGTITADTGIRAVSTWASWPYVDIVNSGSIITRLNGIEMIGKVNLINHGLISKLTMGSANNAIRGDDEAQEVVNYGTIEGTIDLRGGFDEFHMRDGFVDSVDLGDDNDKLYLKGGEIRRADGGNGYDMIYSWLDVDLDLDFRQFETVYLRGSRDLKAFGDYLDDRIYGNSGDNILRGRSGDDTLVGGGGDDSLFGGAGLDTLFGRDGDDRLAGGRDDDTIYGGSGDDSAFGGRGNDIVEASGDGTMVARGGLGYDTIVLNGIPSAGGYFINLLNQDKNAGLAEGSSYLGFEEFVFSGGASNTFLGTKSTDRVAGDYGYDKLFGGGGADSISGGGGDDTLFGGGGGDYMSGGYGDDTLVGDGGGDRLDGGGGADTMTGGAGADTFEFREAFGGGLDETDTITDFAQGTDVIDLSLIDADTGSAGDQAFTLGGNAFTGVAGELIKFKQGGNTHVQGDVDGDGLADLSFTLLGKFTLTVSDFVL